MNKKVTILSIFMALFCSMAEVSAVNFVLIPECTALVPVYRSLFQRGKERASDAFSRVIRVPRRKVIACKKTLEQKGEQLSQKVRDISEDLRFDWEAAQEQRTPLEKEMVISGLLLTSWGLSDLLYDYKKTVQERAVNDMPEVKKAEAALEMLERQRQIEIAKDNALLAAARTPKAHEKRWQEMEDHYENFLDAKMLAKIRVSVAKDSAKEELDLQALNELGSEYFTQHGHNF